MPDDFAPPGLGLFKQPLNPQITTVAPFGGQGFSSSEGGQIPLQTAAGIDFLVGPEHTPQAFYTMAQNRAYFAPVTLPFTADISGLLFKVAGTVSHIDVGIYVGHPTQPYNQLDRVWSRGSATPTTGAGQKARITAGVPGSLRLPAGLYWLGIAADNATTTVLGTQLDILSFSAFYTVGAAYPLPATVSAPASIELAGDLKVSLALYGGRSGFFGDTGSL